MSAVKERPILFSGPMIRALLDGSKTQTRRLVKDQTSAWEHDAYRALCLSARRCPHGVVGDRLWVRETFADCLNRELGDTGEYVAQSVTVGSGTLVVYRADEEPGNDWIKWRPSIFMPRWASRITLTITDVRVERLQHITHADAVAEGMVPLLLDIVKDQAHPLRAATFARGRDIYLSALEAAKCGREEGDAHPDGPFAGTVEAYAALWDSLNAKRALWYSNPWVWVLSFEVNHG